MPEDRAPGTLGTTTVPLASRPEPAGYWAKADAGSGLQAWSDARERFGAARNYWVATASVSGAPHAMPVWGVLRGDCFTFSTSPASRKAHNLAANPRAVVHLEDAAAVIIVEGTVSEVREPTELQAFLDAYNPKYDWDFTLAQVARGVFALRPVKAFAWLGDQGDAFSGTGTRWLFPP